MKHEKKLSARKKRKCSETHREKKRRPIGMQSIDSDQARRAPVDTTEMDEWRAWTFSVWFPQGFYEDKPFVCRDCGTPQIWTAWQQKRWYEQHGGDPLAIAVRCRECRAKERQRKAEARRAHLEGLEKKRGQ